ncbi:hypothetical protein WDU94_010591, partial [Cyamophila willieti]
MASLIEQLLLVLYVALHVAAEYTEFGCDFEDSNYNYKDGKDDFGTYVKSIKFNSSVDFKLFMNTLEEVRTETRYESLYNSMDPFFKMYNAYKSAKAKNPALKFANFFPTYTPNPYTDQVQRFVHDTPFSVINIYQKMQKRYGAKYPEFKDSFYLATCDEDIEKAVLDSVTAGMDQMRTPSGFVHDRIVG